MSRLFWLLVAGLLITQCFSSCSSSSSPSYTPAIAASSYAKQTSPAVRRSGRTPGPRMREALQAVAEGEVFSSGGKVTNLSAPLTVRYGPSGANTCVIRNGSVYCDVGFLKTPYASNLTGMYFNVLSPVIYANGSPLATFNSATGNVDLAFGLTATTTAVVSQYVRIGQFFQADGEADATLQTRVPTGGGLEYGTTSNRWRAYETQGAGAAWNFVTTYNADGGTPLAPAGVATPALQAEANTTPNGFALVSDRSRYGNQVMHGNTKRLVQLGGGMNWALEYRTLTINPFQAEGTLCPRCTECTPNTTIAAMDGQACTDNAAGSTSIVDLVDFRNFVTTAVSGQFSSWLSAKSETRRNKFPHAVFTVYVGAITSERVWYGLSSVALNGADNPVGHIVAFRYSTNASDTKWQFCTGDGATTTCSDTGATVTANRLYALELDCRESSGSQCLATVQAQGTGTPITIKKTTNLPTLTTAMSIRHYCETLTTAAKTCGLGPSVLETL